MLLLDPSFNVTDKSSCDPYLHAFLNVKPGVLVLKHLFEIETVR